jgi:hypothetical protein
VQYLQNHVMELAETWQESLECHTSRSCVHDFKMIGVRPGVMGPYPVQVDDWNRPISNPEWNWSGLA